MAAAAPSPSAVPPPAAPPPGHVGADLADKRPSHDADGDESMTDDMRLAVSALGLMREGSRGAHPASAAPSASSSSSSSAFPPPSSLPAHYRQASTSRRSDPSRSTSAASTASASEAWTSATGTTSETGYSSPVGSASVAGTAADVDADMLSDKGLGEAEMDAAAGGAGAAGAHHPYEDDGADPRFMARVSQLPVISGGIEWYERSKANSRVVKYGAGLVESSFSAVSRPIANTLPPLGPLDDFACRQLDRIGAPGASPGRKSPSSAALQMAQEQVRGDGEEDLRGRSSETTPLGGGRGEINGMESGPERPPLQGRTSSTSGAGQVATVGGQRSRLQTVLLEAGGLGAAVSEESLKSLRYCLQWLLYATAHLDHQIGTLRDFIDSLRAHNRTSSSNALIAASASAHLAQIKHDVVETIRKVVDVVSKYAGAALPEQAKRYVRQSILGLPVKWASAIENRGGPAGRVTRESSVAGSELGTPRPERMGESYFPGAAASTSADGAGKAEGAGLDAQDATALRPTEEAADRILTFAVESLDMLRSVTGIFGESVERAEAWIERLRVIGVDRQRQRQAASTPSSSSTVPAALPASHVGSPQIGAGSATFDDSASLAAGTKRRRAGARASVGPDADEGQGAGEGGAGGAAGASTALESAQLSTDEGDEGASSRRKRGAWRAGAE
ncbi:hypothetical protein Rhopal_005128-T1 [Rhodotorula paludigena]|uniref:Opi1-domain-containing protein n=1 Tax=Rhodotorula paludigena TaxID=86838 RepID=A0AAV5GQC2_9BASI|nr:hypothetical protein Rhopal_005128-T1 [Rhodotorula paludigena]